MAETPTKAQITKLQRSQEQKWKAQCRMMERAHKTLEKTIQSLDCDEHYKHFLTGRLGVNITATHSKSSYGKGWSQHKRLFRSMAPEFLRKSDIDFGLQAAVRTINAGDWAATEWCCAGRAHYIKQDGCTYCYCALIVAEVHAGRLIRLIESARRTADSPAINTTPTTELTNDHANNDLSRSGFLRITVSHYAVSMETVYLWRQMIRRLAKLIAQESRLLQLPQ